MNRCHAMVAAALLSISASAMAEDLFQITARTTSGAPIVRQASGTSAVDITNDLLNAQKGFVAFIGKPFSASLKYAGIENAVRFSSNATGTNVTMSIPSTGFTKTFTGTTRKDVQDKVEKFIKKEGAQDWANFIKSTNRLTLVAPNDGNPQSLTATLATEAFRKFGMRPNTWHQPDSIGRRTDGEFSIDLRGSSIKTDDGNGYAVDVSVARVWPIDEQVSLSVAIPLMYRNIEGSSVYGAGLEVGLPLLVINGGNSGISWQVTPFFTSGLTASEDFVAGGIMLGGGITSLLSLPIRDDLIVSIGNQFSFHEGLALNVSDVKFDTDMHQQIMKNGIQVTYGRDWQIDASLVHTHFFDDAAVDNYITPGVGVTKAFGRASGVHIGYSADLGTGYTAHNLQALVYFGL